jgi:transposase InsO family protein
MNPEDPGTKEQRWARLRFAIVGPLLASPPDSGDLRQQLDHLCSLRWRHPETGEPIQFARSTIERWYYTARRSQSPFEVLRRRVRKDAGTQPSITPALRTAVRTQWQAHKSWSVQLHLDNLAAFVPQHPELGLLPSYATLRRFLKSQGLFRQPRKRTRPTAGTLLAEQHLATFEVRSFEIQYVNGLWHLDFHAGSRKVLTPQGQWQTPHLLGVLDDCSRLATHLQWYLEETAQNLAHGFSQGVQKRGLPRSLMTDQGSAMMAEEIQQGLLDVGILHEPTLPYSPYQNAKQEVFWAAVEGRLMAMLEGVEELTLDLLNQATQAWVELDYNQKIHSEIGQTPLERYLKGPDVGRPSPSSQELRRAFRLKTSRKQRRSDGSLSIEGRRFEVPSRFRHLEQLWVRYARWDLSQVDLVDPRTGVILCAIHPVDKARNAEGLRRTLQPICQEPGTPAPGGIAPLLQKLMREYAATGLPPAYLPTPTEENDR